MRVSKIIGNNAVICIDSRGREVVALGLGIGYGAKLDSELDLSRVRRTFYGIEQRYLPLIEDINPDVFELASQIADGARAVLSYELSPNFAFALADHISFALTRMRENMDVSMPLSMDVMHTYPIEYRLGKNAIKLIQKNLGVSLPDSEAAGIALTMVNAAIYRTANSSGREKGADHVLERCVATIERKMRVRIDREGFDYTRFATHMNYLFARVQSDEKIESENSGLYQSMSAEFPDVAQCAEHISSLLNSTWGRDLSEEERLYLMLHINRMCSKAQRR